MNAVSNLFKGIIKENPVLVLLLGICPTLGITTSVENALGMSAAVLFVLVCSNAIISLLRNIIPEKVRIPCYIVIIATFVTLVEMLMNAFLPELHASLGVFLPLIVVNCIILGRAEMFASKNGVFASILDAIGMAIGFAIALFLMASIREVLGKATFFGKEIAFLKDYTIPLMKESFGGFLVFGLLIAAVNAIMVKCKKQPKAEFGCEGCPSAAECNKTACEKEDK